MQGVHKIFLIWIMLWKKILALQILGFALLVIGCLVKFKEDLVTKYAKELFKVIKLDSADYNLDELLSSSAIVFIIVGVVILIVGVLGCFGACCGWRVFLVIVSVLYLTVRRERQKDGRIGGDLQKDCLYFRRYTIITHHNMLELIFIKLYRWVTIYRS